MPKAGHITRKAVRITGRYYIFPAALLFAVAAILIIPMEYWAGCLLLAGALVLIGMLLLHDRRLALLLLCGLLIRTALIFADQVVGFLPDQPDQVMYNNQAREILQSWSSGLYPVQPGSFAAGTSPYSYMLASLYWPFGYMPLLGRLFNVLTSVLCIYIFYHIILEILDDRQIAWWASLLLAFLPSFIVFSTYILRDTLVNLLTLLMLYSVIKISKRQAVPGYSGLLVLAFLLNALLRIQNLYLFAGFFLVFSIIRVLNSRIDLKAKVTLVLLCTALPTAWYIHAPDSFISVATYFFRAQPLRVEGGSAYLVNMTYNSFWDVIIYLPIRFVYFCFGPFFWQARGLVQWLTSVEGLLLLALTIAAVLYFRRGKKNSYVWLQYLVFGFALAGLLSNSIVDSNFGTAVRHKLNYIIFLFPFALMYLRKFRIGF